MSETISFNIRIKDNGTFKKVEVSADDLKDAIELVKKEADRLNASIVNWAQAGQAAEMLGSAIGQLENVFGSLSAAYSDHVTVETKLAKAMRNTMEATDEEIQSVKDLCDAQERLGVVDGDVQTAAAQELATYLELSSSLKTIIPVMNDMIAQQYGLESSAESATQIATMLGKVMNGQTEALSRYGYKFDEAQKEILQFGTESERAAVLAQVVSESVGGMNEELGRTDAGKMKQLEFQLGKVEEALGSVAQRVMPAITVLAKFGTATTGISQLIASFKALKEAMAGTAIQSKLLAAHQKVQAAAQRLLAASGYTAAAGTKALTIATTALYAAMTMGISLAISGLIALFSKLSDKADDAAGDIETVDEATEAFKQASADARSALAMEVVALENMIKKKELAADKVAELNSKYGESFGYYNTAAEWYDVLKSKSQAYCTQIGYEAQARTIASQKAAKELELQAIAEETARLSASGKHKEKRLTTETYFDAAGNKAVRFTKKEFNTDEYQELIDKGAALRKDIQDLESQFNICVQNMTDAQEELSSSIDGTSQSVSWEKMNLLDLTKAIQEQESKVKSLVGVNEQEAKAENAILAKMKARKDLLEKTYSLTSRSSKNEFDGSNLIENASSYQELGNNIKYYQKQLEKADATDVETITTISAKIAVLKKEQQAIKDFMDAADRPAELSSLEDIDKELAYQQNLRRKASAEQIASIDAEIKRLNDLKTAFEDSYAGSLSDDQINTYDKLNTKLDYYTRKLKTATETERAEIQKKILNLEELKESWDDLLSKLDKPGDISTLDSIDELDDAIAYYSAIQKKAGAEEYQQIQEQIDALKRKKDAIEGLGSIPAMKYEVAELDGLSGKQLKMELQLIGLDGVKAKIKELQDMLDDTENPLNADQRADVEQLIASYSDYQKILQKSNVTVAQGWSNIKGIGNSIKSLTEDLQSDSTAWEKVCSVIDNTFAIYEGLSGIIEMIKMLTTVTNAATVAEETKAAASAASTAQAVTGAAAEVAASGAVATAKGTEATANTAAAASGALSAHSGIPFVGIALGLAAVAAIIAVMSSLPKFAKGGIAYGPTLGLFGEYAGASNNPEVVAPLDRLKSLIGGAGSDSGGTVEFKIDGRVLRGVLSKVDNVSKRS